jgi:hypothetical protein
MSLSSLISSVIADYTTTKASDTSVEFGPLQIVDPITTGPCGDMPIGTVFVQGLSNAEIKKIVCSVLATPYEKPHEFQMLLDEWDPKSLKFQRAGDGTLVRLFFYGGKWLKATNFSLDLEKVNPALSQTKSFETMFCEAAEKVQLNYDMLDVDRVYFFLLEHPENIIILQHTQPNLVFVGSVKVSQKSPFYDVESLDLECPAIVSGAATGTNLAMSFDSVMSTPALRNSLLTNLPSVPSTDEEAASVKVEVDLKAPVTFVGLIATKFDKDGFTRFRLDSPQYKAAKELRGRGSANDRRFKLLSILCGPTSICSDSEKERKLKQFIHVLPNYLPLVKQLNVELDELYHVVFTFYCMFFKDKNPELVAQSFVKFLHKIQKELFFAVIKPRRLRMTKEHIATFILEQDPKQVMHLLKCMREMKELTTAEELSTIMGYTKK